MNKPTASHDGWRLPHIFADAAFSGNIILAQAIGICPVILAGTTLKNGVVLAVCTLLVLLPVSWLMALVGKKVPLWLHPVIYTGVASLLLMGGAFVLDRFISSALYAQLHLFIPLMAVNTLFSYRAGGFSVGNRPSAAVMDALGSSFGFGIVICIVSAVREILNTNTLWDIPLSVQVSLPQAALPFVAFILLGLMAALLQTMSRHTKKGEDTPSFAVSLDDEEEVDPRE